MVIEQMFESEADMTPEISISVRGLVEFVYRSGDLDLRFQGKKKMNDGIRVHQKIQKSQGVAYEAEVSLSRTVDLIDPETGGRVSLVVAGRADGILKTETGYLIDEIKGTDHPLDAIDEETFPVHWAQAKVYGAIFCEDHRLDAIDIQLTYADFEEKEVKRLKQTHTSEALQKFFYETVEAYQKWVFFKTHWLEKRNDFIRESAFPYSTYRKGQRELAVYVFNAIRSERVAFAQAPTGTGKTLSVLYPAIKSLADGHSDRLFYLTPKATGKAVAESAVDLVCGEEGALKSITITSKEKICLNSEVACYPEKCPYTKGYFDRISDVLWEMIHAEDAFTREVISEYAQKGKVCPYELSLEAALFSDVIICDYNYVFDPRVYLRRFFDIPSERYAFLIDEAHNLIDRARNMYSATLVKTQFTELKKQLLPRDGKLKKALEAINKQFLELRKRCDESGIWIGEDLPEVFYEALFRRAPVFESWLVENKEAPYYEDVLNVYFDLLSFLRIGELYGDGHVTYIKDGDNAHTAVKLFCIHPATQLKRFMSNGTSAILFSATLSPMGYYVDVLSGDRSAQKLILPSPFFAENRMLCYIEDVSVKYRDRADSAERLCAYIDMMARERVGNYLVFFPSYAYMELIEKLFQALYGTAYDIIKQDRGLDESERLAFIRTFDETPSDRSSVYFAVMGSHFSEGIDLKGDRLIGAMIVGVGLPVIDFENDLIKAYYDSVYGTGFEFAYQYPGINKVMQSAGRVIRDESDRGVVLLVDGRYKGRYYRQHFPEDWGRQFTTLETLTKTLKKFWEETP